MEEWKECRLGDLCIDNKGSYGIAASAAPYSEDLYTYLRITDINDDGTLNKSDLKSVADENAEQYILQPNDIVFARTGGSTGRNYFYDGSDGVFVYAGFLIKFSIDPNKVNPKYIKYFCLSQEYKNWVYSFNTGSTRGNINAQTYANMPVILPPRSQQDLLVRTLSSLDDKIELNNKINTNLEQQAQALFKNWFVDFEPFGGKMPEGWKEVSLNDVCLKITDGSHYSPKDDEQAEIPMLSVKDMEKYGFNTKDCKHINEEEFNKMLKNDCVPQVNDILVAKDGSYLKEIFICNKFEKLAILSSIAIFRPNTKIIYPEILLTLLKSPRVMKEVKDNYVSGSALPRIVLKDFKKLKFFIPNISEQSKLAKILSEIRFQIDNNVKENQNLSKLRDTLLPKLMNGEIEV